MTETSESKIKVLEPGSLSWIYNEFDIREKMKSTLLSALQMQNLCVLAGSGTSLGTVGGPSMENLWKSAAEENGKIKGDVEEIAKSLNFDTSKRPNIEEFLSLCESKSMLDSKNAKLISVLKNFKKTVLEKCSFTHNDNSLDGHITFLHRLSRRRTRDSRLKVFTTNYDTCFETAAGKSGLIVLDGFSFSYPRKYDPKFFEYDIVRRSRSGSDLGNFLEGVFQIYKLHGSVNWARNGSEIEQRENPDPDSACIIYPAKGKYQQAFIQPHLELLSQYFSSLREPNTCLIVSGFGFNDDHFSEPILSAIKTNPHMRVIIVDFNAMKNWQDTDGNCSVYWKKLKDLALQGEDIWFIDSSFQEFANQIPDLRSLTPADQLLNTVKTIVGNNK